LPSSGPSTFHLGHMGRAPSTAFGCTTANGFPGPLFAILQPAAAAARPRQKKNVGVFSVACCQHLSRGPICTKTRCRAAKKTDIGLDNHDVVAGSYFTSCSSAPEAFGPAYWEVDYDYFVSRLRREGGRRRRAVAAATRTQNMETCRHLPPVGRTPWFYDWTPPSANP